MVALTEGTRPFRFPGLLGFGGAPLGNLFTEVDRADVDATLEAAWAVGIRYFDTAPLYGLGLSERRLGDFLRSRAREQYVLSTKVGRLLITPPPDEAVQTKEWPVGALPFDVVFDYSYAGIMRSYEDSLQRLGLDRIDYLVVHDLDLWHHGSIEVVDDLTAQLAESGVHALEELRDSKRIRAFGAGVNEPGTIARLLPVLGPDFFLVAMEYTLLQHAALEIELAQCDRAGVAVVAAAVFNSGILATGAVDDARYNYGPASAEILDRVRRIERVCRDHGVTLPAAAMRFPTGHPAVVGVVVGARTAQEVVSAAQHASVDIDPALWPALRDQGLISTSVPIPGN